MQVLHFRRPERVTALGVEVGMVASMPESMTAQTMPEPAAPNDLTAASDLIVATER